MPYATIEGLPSSIRTALPKHAQRIYMSAFNSAYNQYKTDSRAAAVAWSAVKRKYKKNEKDEWVMKSEYLEYDTFFVEAFEFKGEDGIDYVEGVISNNKLDRVNDLMSSTCLVDMVNQIEGQAVELITTAQGGKLKVNMDHEHITKDKRIMPVALVAKAWIEKVGELVEAKVRVKLNKFHDDYAKLKGSIKEGFIDGFSIEFLPDKFVMKGKVRMLDKIKLGGLAFTGRPICPACKITDICIKSLALEEANEENVEDVIMTEEKQPKVETEIVDESKSEEQPKVEAVPEAGIKPVAEVTEEKPVEEAVAEPAEQEVKSEVKDETDYKTMFEAKSKEFEEMKARLSAIEQKLEVKAEAAEIVLNEVSKVEVKAKDLVEEKEEKFETKSNEVKDFKERFLESKGIKSEVK